MEERGAWPTKSLRVHSANPSGAERMRQFIARHWPGHGERRKRVSDGRARKGDDAGCRTRCARSRVSHVA
jgi:hypothetical protein